MYLIYGKGNMIQFVKYTRIGDMLKKKIKTLMSCVVTPFPLKWDLSIFETFLCPALIFHAVLCHLLILLGNLMEIVFPFIYILNFTYQFHRRNDKDKRKEKKKSTQGPVDFLIQPRFTRRHYILHLLHRCHSF